MSMPKLFPLTGWTQAAGAAAAPTPAIDISNMPAGMGGDPAYVDAFLLRLTLPNTFAGGSAAVTYQDLARCIPSVGLSSQVYGDLFGGGGGILTGTDIYNWIQPFMGWGPLCHGSTWPYPNGIGAAAGAVNRIIDLYLPLRNYRNADPSDCGLPTVGFRGDSIQMTLGAQTVLGANTTLGTCVCTPFAVISTKKERRAPTVRQWGVATSANAEIVLPPRAYGHVSLMSNLVGLGGPGAVSAYTGMQVARGDQYVGLTMTPENIAQEFFSTACGTVMEGTLTGATGVAGSLAWPFNPAAAVAVTGATLDPQLLALPIIYERFGAKLSQIDMSNAKLSIQTAGVAGTHRLLYAGYAPQSEAFLGRMASLYGMRNPVTRPKLLKPPRDGKTGVKKAKTSLLPFSLFESNGK